MALDSMLNRLAASVSEAQDLESLTRPMLEMLEQMTGLSSTYLTTIDFAHNTQSILYARNASEKMKIPEGLTVPWGDTLCRRAMEEKRPYVEDVPSVWPESQAAKALGIQTYISEPVRTMDGQVYGTLCAASSERTRLAPETHNVFSMMAKMIAQQVDRERMLEDMRKANAELAHTALTDPLTGVANRRAMEMDLKRMLSRAARDGSTVQVAFVDLDGFKGINDTYGHDVGDRFLVHIAKLLAGRLRTGDVLARTGGDEFVVLAPAEDGAELSSLQERLAKATIGRFTHGGVTIDYRGASVGVAISSPGEIEIAPLLASADAAMYEVKRKRKSSGASPPRPH